MITRFTATDDAPTRYRVNLDAFGDRTKASSRLRAWMLAERLQALGHEATLNGPLDVDVQVFQKDRNGRRLQAAKANGARIVYDFDDNFLLEDAGARDDVIAFMNLADVVTVGSHDLLVQARRYHDRVLLFENPLDVLPGSLPKVDYRWAGRLAWFGNPENVGVLDDLGLRAAVTTITARGDVPWALETVDDLLKGFDLVLLPVRANAWTLAKNANRLLKCVALGVPFLASDTPEHRRVVELLRLPPWLLVGDDDNWHECIAHVQERYAELPPLLWAARAIAKDRYDIVPVAERWLQDVMGDGCPAPAPLDLTVDMRQRIADVDVVVLAEDDPGLVEATVASLRPGEVGYRSLSVVSAHPLPAGSDQPASAEVRDRHADYFDIYPALARVMAGRTGAATLLLRAGARVGRGLFAELADVNLDAVTLFRAQVDHTGIKLAASPPGTLADLLERPYRPAACLLPHRAYRASPGFQARFGHLALWELLIALVGRQAVPLRTVSAPLVMVLAGLDARTPMQAFADFLRETSPTSVADLPGLDHEWARLAFVLHAATVDEHHDLFHGYASTIIPRLHEDVLWGGRPRRGRQEQQRAHAWLGTLAGEDPAGPPRLVRTVDGTVFLLEGGLKRHVTTGLLVEALEPLFGPVARVAAEALADLKHGPPAAIFHDGAGQPCFVAGGRRYPVRGLPLPVTAPAERLAAFPAADTCLDLTPHHPDRDERRWASSWLGALAGDAPAAAPRLVRAEDGTVFLLDGDFKRHVAARLLADALEALFGPIAPVADEELTDLEPGPPATVFHDGAGRAYFVAGGRRYAVHGLPLAVGVPFDQLDAFAPTEAPLDLAERPRRVAAQP